MIVYRIAHSRHASDISGTGAAIYPGRWNKKGTPVIYSGESREIALLENIVHNEPLFYPKLDVLIMQIPDDSILILGIGDLPKSWSRFPAPTILAEIGQKWVDAAETLALRVPSSIIQTSSNIVLNCNHPRYGEVEILEQKKFDFDPRLLK